MAIGYAALIKNKRLTEEVLLKKLESMGYICATIERLPKGIAIDLNEELGFSIYLINAGSYPYNSWITDFNQDEYIFNQTLEFRFLKDFSGWEKRYKVMLALVFDLMLDLREEALLLSNGDTELCMFKENGKIYLKNKSEIWNRKFFKDIIAGKNIEYVTEI